MKMQLRNLAIILIVYQFVLIYMVGIKGNIQIYGEIQPLPKLFSRLEKGIHLNEKTLRNL